MDDTTKLDAIGVIISSMKPLGTIYAADDKSLVAITQLRTTMNNIVAIFNEGLD